jgi:hypothetical protein
VLSAAALRPPMSTFRSLRDVRMMVPFAITAVMVAAFKP